MKLKLKSNFIKLAHVIVDSGNLMSVTKLTYLYRKQTCNV